VFIKNVATGNSYARIVGINAAINVKVKLWGLVLRNAARKTMQDTCCMYPVGLRGAMM